MEGEERSHPAAHLHEWDRGWGASSSSLPIAPRGHGTLPGMEQQQGSAGECSRGAQLCGFQSCLIDSCFLAPPLSPNPHMHFSC